MILSQRLSTASRMRQIILAVIPGIAVLAMQNGLHDLLLILVSALLGHSLDRLCQHWRARARRQPAPRTLDSLPRNDYSGLLSGLLLGALLPGQAPLWLALVAVSVAIIGVKQLYGGLGQHPFNPVMAAYVVLCVFLPGHMLPSAAASVIDVHLAPLAFALGALYLLSRDLLSAAIVSSQLLTLLALSAVATLFNSADLLITWQWLLSGHTVLIICFIATDSSAATAPRARLAYGAAIAALALVLQRWGSYPEPFAFAIVLINALVPALDFALRGQPLGLPHSKATPDQSYGRWPAVYRSQQHWLERQQALLAGLTRGTVLLCALGLASTYVTALLLLCQTPLNLRVHAIVTLISMLLIVSGFLLAASKAVRHRLNVAKAVANSVAEAATQATVKTGTAASETGKQPPAPVGSKRVRTTGLIR